MPIELLYIVPIIALVIFTFTISFIAQKRSASIEQGKKLEAEVRQFNDGKFIALEQTTENKLKEFERTIASINKALSNQQKVIEKFTEENSAYNRDIDTLKKNLDEVQREYIELQREHDIVVSENYSLRAQFNKLVKKTSPASDLRTEKQYGEHEPDAFISMQTSQPKPGYEMNLSVLDETKVLLANGLDDTSVIDISEIFK